MFLPTFYKMSVSEVNGFLFSLMVFYLLPEMQMCVFSSGALGYIYRHCTVIASQFVMSLLQQETVFYIKCDSVQLYIFVRYVTSLQ